MTSKELIRRLEADGWQQVRVKGSHHQFRHPTKPGTVTVPHPKKEMTIGTLRSIYRQAGLRWQPWQRLFITKLSTDATRTFPMHIIATIDGAPGTYGVSFPDLPGCVAVGATLDEALASAAEAVTFHLETMVEHGDAVPTLRTLDQLRALPDFQDDFNGSLLIATVPFNPPSRAVRINISLDKHLLAAVDRAVKLSGSTRSGFLAEAARARLSAR
jgi:predicted RNA binding protein YcfA (HicA-like mRNA interferase family)/predicted RNase H-like HicB family nuclease